MREEKQQPGTRTRWAAGRESFARIVAAVVLLAACGCQSSGGKNPASVQSAGDAQQEISALLDRYNQALLNKDTVALDRIWADNLTFINLRGQLLDKQDRLNNIKSGATAFKSCQVSDKKIRTFGQSAVATLNVAIEGQYSGQPGSGNFAVTTVWARTLGQWQMVAGQMTRVL